MKFLTRKTVLFPITIILLIAIYAYQLAYLDKSLTINDTIENFTLPNYRDSNINLYDELKKGPVVLSFYRGGWCPICNIQLRSYQANLEVIESFGAKLIAVSPETPSNSEATAVSNLLNFEVLYDKNNNLARKLGIVWEIPEDRRQGFALWLQNSSNKTLKDFNDQEGYELPIPATFVIDKNAKVVYAFKDVDYRNRANIDEILEALSKIK